MKIRYGKDFAFFSGLVCAGLRNWSLKSTIYDDSADVDDDDDDDDDDYYYYYYYYYHYHY